MKINQSTLLKALTTVNKAVSTSLIIPALENYQFIITPDTLHVAANNLQFYITTSVPITEGADGNIQINAAKLLEFVKGLPEQPITFTFSDGQAVITYANKGILKLPTEPGADFPTPEFPKTKQTAVISSDVFNEGLYKTVWAKEAKRPDNVALECVNLLLTPGSVKFLTGSGKCVAVHTIACAHGITADLLIPDGSLAALEFPAETDLSLIVDKDKLSFQYGDTSIVVTLHDGKFPDVRAFDFVADKFATLDRAQLVSTLTRLKTFAGGENSAVTLAFGEQLTIKAQNIAYAQSAEETIYVQYTGEPITIMCNCHILITALRKMTDAHMGLLGDRIPICLRETPEADNRFYVAPCTA